MLFDAPRDTDSMFEQLFEVFPKKRKGTRRMALPAWRAAIKREEPEVILAGAIAYAASEPGDFGKGLPAWLNSDLWAWDYTPQEKKPDKSVQKSRYFELKKRYAKPFSDWMSDAEKEEMRKLEKELANG